MEQQGKSGFEIGGRTYPVPTLDTFDFDEAQVLYDYSGCVLEDFVQAPAEASEEERNAHEAEVLRKALAPGFKRALVHVAYQRGNRDVSPSKVKEIVSGVNMLSATLALYGGDDVPPAETETPSPQRPSSVSGTSPLLKSMDSGRSSMSDTDLPAATLAHTGTGE